MGIAGVFDLVMHEAAREAQKRAVTEAQQTSLKRSKNKEAEGSIIEGEFTEVPEQRQIDYRDK